MTNEQDQSRRERLSAALRENLKRRKSQAKGRAGHVIVTPEDDAAIAAADANVRTRSGDDSSGT